MLFQNQLIGDMDPDAEDDDDHGVSRLIIYVAELCCVIVIAFCAGISGSG